MRTTMSILMVCVVATVLAACSKKLNGFVTLDGSDTVYPLSKALADDFHQHNPGVWFFTQFSGTGGGFRKFCAGHVDIQNASRAIKTAEDVQCKANHVEYIELPMAFDSLTVTVNSKNSFVDCLTVKELRAIWEPAAEGRITNWQQVRAVFPSQPLTLYGPGKDSGTFDYFTFAVVGTEASSRADYSKSEDYTVVEHGVETDANALGYFPYAYYQSNKDKLKLVAIDNGHGCILPSARSVTDNTYQPLTRPLLLYVNVNAAERPWVKEFVHSYLSMGSTETVSKIGYVPLTAAGLALQTTRFDKGVTGSALGGHGSVVGVVRDWLDTDEEDKVNAQLAQ